MMNNAPDYFSHKLELRLGKMPAKVSDRTSWRLLLPGIIFGALLFLLGIYEFLNGFRQGESGLDDLIGNAELSDYEPLINPAFFDVVFMAVGLGMIVASILSYLRYRKIIFDGKTVIIGNRPIFGRKQILREGIKNYLGVRFRIEFIQIGFLNKNKYIVELYHKDRTKMVPLYISTSSRNIRKIWEYYARQFNLPALMDTDQGLSSRDVKNLDRSLKEMAELGYVIDNYNSNEKHPPSVAYVRKKDKIVLKARKIVWDAYNIMAWAAILIVALLTGVASLNFNAFKQNFSETGFYVFCGSAALLIIFALFVLFRKEKLVLKKYKIVNTHKYMLFSTKHDELPKASIESIEITQNPASGRFFVSVISDDKTITFGAKLPIEDLRWVKKFLIHEIIK